jgi:hypothetical protein
MTKVIILGEQPEKKELKPIEFISVLTMDNKMVEPRLNPKNYLNIELICKNYLSKQSFDLMFAYHKVRNEGCLYLGHFNDGVV